MHLCNLVTKNPCVCAADGSLDLDPLPEMYLGIHRFAIVTARFCVSLCLDLT